MDYVKTLSWVVSNIYFTKWSFSGYIGNKMLQQANEMSKLRLGLEMNEKRKRGNKRTVAGRLILFKLTLRDAAIEVFSLQSARSVK